MLQSFLFMGCRYPSGERQTYFYLHSINTSADKLPKIMEDMLLVSPLMADRDKERTPIDQINVIPTNNRKTQVLMGVKSSSRGGFDLITKQPSDVPWIEDHEFEFEPEKSMVHLKVHVSVPDGAGARVPQLLINNGSLIVLSSVDSSPVDSQHDNDKVKAIKYDIPMEVFRTPIQTWFACVLQGVVGNAVGVVMRFTPMVLLKNPISLADLIAMKTRLSTTEVSPETCELFMSPHKYKVPEDKALALKERSRFIKIQLKHLLELPGYERFKAEKKVSLLDNKQQKIIFRILSQHIDVSGMLKRLERDTDADLEDQRAAKKVKVTVDESAATAEMEPRL